ncbi:MAG: alpha/beta fold hydrolase, partial [Pseudomonadota bacterium]
MGHVGYRTGQFSDPNRRAWEGETARPLAWSAWFPTSSPGANAKHAMNPVFQLGPVIADADLSDDEKFSVVLLSHGTGGSPESLGWLARSLAERGYLVIGAHHHGNTGREPYRAEGFLCWWERATDLSELLTHHAQSGPFAGRLDLSRVHAIGFSLGGYAALALAGATTSVDLYLVWAELAGVSDDLPREFPNLGAHVRRLLETSPVFRDAWARQGDSFADPRIRSIITMAAAPAVRGFHPETVSSITLSVTLITGEADTEAPSKDCSDWLLQQNPGFTRFSVGEHVGHYTFLGHPAGPVDAAQ